MAKISANGATKLAERRRNNATALATYGQDSRTETVAVLTSDGRILTRLIHSDGASDGYKVAARIRNARNRNPVQVLDIFHAYCDRRGYEPRVGQRDLTNVAVELKS